MNHTLKTVQPFYNDVESGSKTFDVRYIDRNFAVGDILTIQEFPYTGRELKKEVGYVLSHDDFPQGLKEGYVVLGLIDIPCTQDTDSIGHHSILPRERYISGLSK